MGGENRGEVEQPEGQFRDLFGKGLDEGGEQGTYLNVGVQLVKGVVDSLIEIIDAAEEEGREIVISSIQDISDEKGDDGLPVWVKTVSLTVAVKSEKDKEEIDWKAEHDKLVDHFAPFVVTHPFMKPPDWEVNLPTREEVEGER